MTNNNVGFSIKQKIEISDITFSPSALTDWFKFFLKKKDR